MQTVILRSCIMRLSLVCNRVLHVSLLLMGHYVFMLPTLCHHMTHRARYVRAGCPLAVGSGCGCTSDFLLLPQQLTVLLLSVLHVNQQRDEAVLHLLV